MKKIDKGIEILKNEQENFLNYLKAQYPVFHNSNFFFRDLQYGVRRYLDKKGIELSYPESETVAGKYGKILEEEGIFQKVNNSGWRINYPEFVTQVPGDPL